MKSSVNTTKRVVNYLKQMKKAMPAIKDQINKYEKSLAKQHTSKPSHKT